MALSIIGKSVPTEIKGKFQFQQTGTVLRNASDIREMRQVSHPGLAYEFYFPPTTFNHSGYGPTFSEINRPFSQPIVDITNGKAERCSFEFLVAPPKRINSQLDASGKPSTQTYQDFFESVDDQIKFIQTIVDYAIPVEFVNVHPALAIPKWYIDDCTINHGRQNLQAKTTNATVNLSLIEFIPRRKTMILLPLFKYGKFKPKIKTDPPTTVDYDKDHVAILEEKLAATRTLGMKEEAKHYALLIEKAKHS